MCNLWTMHVSRGQWWPLCIRLKEIWNGNHSHYMTVINLKDIVFPMTLNKIKKFENLNDISINVYCIEKQKELSILPIQLTDTRRRSMSICCMCKTTTGDTLRG